MAEPQLHKILVGLVLIGLIVAGISIFMSNSVATYGVLDYDEDNLQTFNLVQNISNDVVAFDGNSTSVGTEGSNDILGSFFSNAYTGATVLKNSISLSQRMVNDAADNLPLGAYGYTVKLAIGTIIIIIISVGIFLHFITKSNRT